jgi:hypothetical protein
MYNSNPNRENDSRNPERAQEQTHKGQALKTLLKLGYNLIPADQKKVARVKWEHLQQKRVSSDAIVERAEKFPGSNWLILTGSKPYTVTGRSGDYMAPRPRLCRWR